ncbi:MAG: endonuclease/exonuclease/phosphatase family protein [Planctomycetota bacterium]|nr:endonuclease/exonuclease/phosphatase family protein [Planctomycetota bacterium]
MSARAAFPALALLLAASSVFAEQTTTDEVEVPRAPALRVLSWNIQCGTDAGEKANGWPERKGILKELLLREEPDLLCTQEALKNQVDFIQGLFPKYKRIGVGRDDGKDEGEFCAIFYDPRRLKEAESGTFWLSETPGQPSACWNDATRRIVTWARFEDLREGKKFLVYNTHWPQNAAARQKSARLIAKKIHDDDSGAPILLAADLNCAPGAKEWRILAWAGLVNTETATGAPFLHKTFQYGGVPVSTIDAIFVNKGWGVRGHKVIDERVEKKFASDHFGIAALVSLSGPTVRVETTDPKVLGLQSDPLTEKAEPAEEAKTGE